MKMLLDSDPTLCSQNRYDGMTGNTTRPDPAFVKNFHLPQVALMSLWNFDAVDINVLMTELTLLEASEQRWLLKTHHYLNYPYPVLDLVPCPQSLPFVVKATMIKNFSQSHHIRPYHLLRSKIEDTDTRYQFDCFNLAVDCVNTRYDGIHRLPIRLLFGSYHDLCAELQRMGFVLGHSSAPYHGDWVKKNAPLMPSTLYTDMITAGIFDHQAPGLSIEERACMLALNGGRFRDLLIRVIKTI